MKRIIIILLLTASQQLIAQNCIDTVRVKGFYIVKKRASEQNPTVTRNGEVTTIETNIDTHVDPSFVPCDSISKQKPLSYWLNHFFDDATQVFVSCKQFRVKSFVSKECIQEKSDICLFPALKPSNFYQTTNLNTGDIFEIYYLDAYWGRIKVKTGSLEADMIPSKIAQRSISPNLTAFDLYYFIRSNKIDMKPKIKDSNITIWKKK